MSTDLKEHSNQLPVRLQNKRDKLLEYLKNPPEEINSDMEELWARYEFCYNNLKKHSKRGTSEILQKKFKIGRSMAYLVIRETELFFGAANAISKEFLRNLMVENILEDLRAARAKGDLRAVSSLYKNLATWAGIYDLENELDPDKLKLQQFNVQIINIDAKQAAEVAFDDIMKLDKDLQRTILSEIEADTTEWEEIHDQIEQEKAFEKKNTTDFSK